MPLASLSWRLFEGLHIWVHSQSTISPCPPQLHPPPCHRLSYTTAWHQSHFCHRICNGTEPIQCTTPLAITCYVCSLNIPTHSLYDPQHCSKYHIRTVSALLHATSLLFVTLCYPWPHEPETPSCCPTVPLAMMQPSVQNPQYFHFPM